MTNAANTFWNASFGARSAQIRPIHVGAQVFAADGSVRFALNRNGERFAARLAVGDVCKVPSRCVAARGKSFALNPIKPHEICLELFHADDITPSGVCEQHRSVNFAQSLGLV